MQRFIVNSSRILQQPLRLGPRGLLLVAALLLVPAYVSPLWNLTMFAPQYSDGLRLDIYSWKLEGGNRGQDVKEINILHHYSGMRGLAVEDLLVPVQVLESAQLGELMAKQDVVLSF